MSTRKIKEAKDLSSGELIYFKGHAKATYMSDGSTVEDSINQLKNNSGSGGNADLSDYETKEDALSKFQEAKSYTDNKTNELRDIVTQTLSLNSGVTWCSFYVDITLEQLQQALGANAISITTSFDGSTEVTSSYDASTNTWSGELTDLDITKMYILKTNTECEISLTGRKIPNSNVYTLNHGWNWISYPVGESVYVKDAIRNIIPTQGDVIRSQLTSAVYMYGTWVVSENQYGDFYMNPGQGYKYNNASTEPKTLIFTTELIDTKSELLKKQDTLVSGENIKTINGESLLGEGDISIPQIVYVPNESSMPNPIVEGVLYLIGDEKSLISFTIEGTSYQAEEGMTWEEWVNSEYNVSNAYIHNNDYVILGGIIIFNGVSVFKTDIIIDGTEYQYYSSGGA